MLLKAALTNDINQINSNLADKVNKLIKSEFLYPNEPLIFKVNINQNSLLAITDGFGSKGALYLIGEGYQSLRIFKIFSTFDEQQINVSWTETNGGIAEFEVLSTNDAICTYTIFNYLSVM